MDAKIVRIRNETSMEAFKVLLSKKAEREPLESQMKSNILTINSYAKNFA